jgi:hypothetical protein
MQQFGGKDSKRHFTVVIGNKEHGLYVSSTPSSAAKKAVTKLCSANKSKKVEFCIREITQGSDKKVYGPYSGHIDKLKEPIELKGRVIRYKPIAKLKSKSSKKEGMIGGFPSILSSNNPEANQTDDNRDREIIAFIKWEEPELYFSDYDSVDLLYEYYIKLKELDVKSNIFSIDISDESRNPFNGTRGNTTILIEFDNFSNTNEKNENYRKELGIIIDFLKFCIETEKDKDIKEEVKFEFKLQEPDEKSYTPEFNEFLKELKKRLYPTKMNTVPNIKFYFKYNKN